MPTLTSQAGTKQVDRPGGWTDDVVYAAVAICFLLSGFAALVYQTAWMRQFGTVFGTSHLAVATVLAAYMGGLALGARLAGYYESRIRNPIRMYALLEAGIGISAILLPVALVALRAIQVASLGGQSDLPDASGAIQSIFYTSAAFVVLAIPTTFMGATLPLLTRYAVRHDAQVGPRVGMLYGVNTLGAVIGVLAAGFVLVPGLGLFGAVAVGVAANFFVFMVAAKLAKTTPVHVDAGQTSIDKAPQTWHWILLIILLSGANSFYLEVLWTRLLNHTFGGTLIAFSTMLATFLIGIAIGGGFIGRFATNSKQALRLFAVAQFMIAISSLTTYRFIDSMVPGQGSLLANVFFAGIVMLPTTLFIGATFPLAVRVITRNQADAANQTSRVYSWNTAGAIFGALAAGFVLIPWLGFSLGAKTSGLLSLSLAAGAILLLRERRTLALASTLVIFFAVAFAYDAPRPETLFRALTENSERSVTELFYGVGRSATIIVNDVDGSLEMRSDGLPESTIFRRGSPPSKHSQYWLTALPTIARPNAESMLMIGLGGGVALESLPPRLQQIDVVEIEPEVIRANRAMSELRRMDPLADERLRLVVNDARSALTLSEKRFDIIVSQPSHPWTAGASHLYTREFLKLARSRLSDNGVLLQWINAQYIDEDLLASLAATIDDVFVNVRLYSPLPNVLLFLASDHSLAFEVELALQGSLADYTGFDYRDVGIASLEDILSAWVLDEVGVSRVAKGARINTDDRNRLATHSYPDGSGFTSAELVEFLSSNDVLVSRENDVFFDPRIEIEWPYIATQLVQTRLEKRAFRIARSFDGRVEQLVIDGLGYASFGQITEAQSTFSNANSTDPDDSAAAFSLLKPYLGIVWTDSSYARLDAIADSLPQSAKAVIYGWQAGQNGDWKALQALDDELRQVRETDLWYPVGVKLRVDWRLAYAQTQGELKYGEDAIVLLDNVLAFYWNFDLYVLRAASAIVAGDSAAFLESAWWAAELIALRLRLAEQGRYQFSGAEMRSTAARLSGLKRELDRSVNASGDRRARQVSELLGDTLRRMGDLFNQAG